jgi:hypothetical protein
VIVGEILRCDACFASSFVVALAAPLDASRRPNGARSRSQFATCEQNPYFGLGRRRAGDPLWRRAETRSYLMIVKSFNC